MTIGEFRFGGEAVVYVLGYSFAEAPEEVWSLPVGFNEDMRQVLADRDRLLDEARD